MDHGPGLLRAFLNQLGTLLKGVGPRLVRGCASIAGLLDGLAEAVRSDSVLFISMEMHLSKIQFNFYNVHSAFFLPKEKFKGAFGLKKKNFAKRGLKLV